MKKTILFLHILIIVICSNLLISCSNNLENENAQDAILQFMEIPKNKPANHTVAWERRLIELKVTDARDSYEKNQVFVRNDLITLTNTSEYSMGSGLKYYHYIIGPKGTPYVHGEPYNFGEKHLRTGTPMQYGQVVTVCGIELNQITGIISNEQNKTAKVEFNFRRTIITPFGQCFGLQENDLINFSADFILYNDGWRLQPGEDLIEFKRNLTKYQSIGKQN